MTNLPLGMIILVVASILVFFGVAQRLLDRLKLSDKAALVIIGALIVGSFIDIPLWRGNTEVILNVGGGLVPIGLTVYLLITAGTTKEWVRALIATVGCLLYTSLSLLQQDLGHGLFVGIVFQT